MNKCVNIALLLLSVLITLGSCRGKGTDAHLDGDTLTFKYAKQIHIVKCKDYTVVILNDPWNNGKILHTYILVPSDKNIPSDLPQGTIVRTPLKRAVVTTSVHCGLIMSFGKQNNIKGVCDIKYINLPWIQQQCKEKKIADCGNGITPTLEKIIEINADAVLISPFQNSGGYGRLNEWEKPIIETADYMETSALGRAEWMKFYGMLFGAEKQADSIFNEVEAKYNGLKKIAKAAKTKHSVIIDKINSSVWYVPGGQSTIGQIISDANADYSFSNEKSSGSLALPFETVLEKAGNSDIWLIRYNSPQKATYKSLLTEHGGYSQFKAFKNKMVFGCNTYSNTFYEDTPFHPDMLLRDIIIITHPEITMLGKPRYFEQIK